MSLQSDSSTAAAQPCVLHMREEFSTRLTLTRYVTLFDASNTATTPRAERVEMLRLSSESSAQQVFTMKISSRRVARHDGSAGTRRQFSTARGTGVCRVGGADAVGTQFRAAREQPYNRAHSVGSVGWSLLALPPNPQRIGEPATHFRCSTDKSRISRRHYSHDRHIVLHLSRSRLGRAENMLRRAENLACAAEQRIEDGK